MGAGVCRTHARARANRRPWRHFAARFVAGRRTGSPALGLLSCVESKERAFAFAHPARARGTCDPRPTGQFCRACGSGSGAKPSSASLSRPSRRRATAEEQSRRLQLQVETGALLTRTLDGSSFTGELVRSFIPILGDFAGLLCDVQGTSVEFTWAATDGSEVVAHPSAMVPNPELAAALDRAC